MSSLSLPAARRVFAAYGELPELSGRSYLPISFLARLPLTMAPVAVLALVAGTTGSPAVAGAAVAAFAGGSAVGAPVLGSLADRFGQRVVLLPALLLNAVALGLLGLAPASPLPVVVGLCVAAGLAMPQVGSLSRARWLALTRGRPATALAYEGTVDETAYVLGPALAGVLGTALSPQAPVLVAAGLVLLAVGAFAVHPTHAAPPRRILVPGPRGSAEHVAERHELLRAVLLPTVALVLMGVLFAAVQSGVTVFADEVSTASTGGLLYALMAVGSAFTALSMAALPDRIGPRLRCSAAASVLVVGVAAMALSDSLGTLAAAVLFSGLGVGPMLVTLHSVAGRRAPADRTATAMAALSSGSVTGVALGALLAGPLAASYGPAGAFAVALAAAALLLLLSLSRLPRR